MLQDDWEPHTKMGESASKNRCLFYILFVLHNRLMECYYLIWLKIEVGC